MSTLSAFTYDVQTWTLTKNNDKNGNKPGGKERSSIEIYLKKKQYIINNEK